MASADGNDAGSDDGGDDDDDSSDNPETQKVSSSTGQPDNDDAAVALKQFYHGEAENGCKPLHLAQIMAAQSRTNPQCDQPVDTFDKKVWDDIKAKDKKNSTGLVSQINKWVAESPLDRTDIVQAVYPTVHDILSGLPYNVPGPILDSFTAMNVPEVVEWLVSILGN